MSLPAADHNVNFLETQLVVFPLHILLLALRFIAINLGLIPHDNVIRKVLTFTVITFVAMAADIHMRGRNALPLLAWA
jgi:hypothetical protein